MIKFIDMIDYDKNLLKNLTKEHNLDFIVLFGSGAKNRFKKNSDIDIAVKTKYPIDIKKYTLIQREIANAFKTKDVKIGLIEISFLLSPVLIWQIAKDGKILAGNSLDFRKFQLFALKQYFDTKKFRDLTKRYIHQNLYAQ